MNLDEDHEEVIVETHQCCILFNEYFDATLGKFSFGQMLDTDNVKSETVILETTNSSGQVTLQTYEQDVDGMTRYYKLLDALNHTIIGVHRRLNGEIFSVLL